MAIVAHDVEVAPAPVEVTPGRAHAARPRRGEGAGLALWCTLVAVALVWGTLAVRHADVGLHAAPFKGHWAWHGGWRLLPAAALGLAVAGWGPRVAAQLRWARVPVVAGSAAAAWTAALAAGDELDRITAPLASRFEYEPFAAGIGDLRPFLGTYVDRLGGYPVHLQGHPPGPVVLAWALDRIGLAGAGWLALVAIGAWGVAVAAALVTARAIAGERAARRAAPALVVLPAAVWAGTSVDPVFAALAAVAVAFASTAVTSGAADRFDDRAMVTAVGAGLVFGAALSCSYGTVPLGLVLVAAVVAGGAAGRKALPVVVLALVGLGALAVLAVAAAAGFWWPAGLAATRAAYWEGIGRDRPGGYLTLVGNPGALALATGPLVAVGLGRLVSEGRRAAAALLARRRPVPARPNVGVGAGAGRGASRGRVPAGCRWLLPGAALMAVGLADLSQLARGEVERIWLPFVPWLALAAPGDRRGWLAVQVGVALALQSLLVSPW